MSRLTSGAVAKSSTPVELLCQDTDCDRRAVMCSQYCFIHLKRHEDVDAWLKSVESQLINEKGASRQNFVDAEIRNISRLEYIILSDVDFTGAEFSSSDFSYVQFNSCDFTETFFMDCSFFGAEFSDCVIRNARFAKSNLRQIVVYRSTIEGGRLFAEDSPPQLKMESTRCVGLKLPHMQMKGAELRDVRFEGCDLSGVDFGGATLHNVIVTKGSDLHAARVTRSQVVEGQIVFDVPRDQARQVQIWVGDALPTQPSGTRELDADEVQGKKSWEKVSLEQILKMEKQRVAREREQLKRVFRARFVANAPELVLRMTTSLAISLIIVFVPLWLVKPGISTLFSLLLSIVLAVAIFTIFEFSAYRRSCAWRESLLPLI